MSWCCFITFLCIKKHYWICNWYHSLSLILHYLILYIISFLEIFAGALTEKKYECYLSPDTKLPMIHMDDCCRATLDFIDAKDSVLTRRTYNLAGMSFSNRDLELEILKYKLIILNQNRTIPDFVCTYKPDFRDPIAKSWPESLTNEDNKDWG